MKLFTRTNDYPFTARVQVLVGGGVADQSTTSWQWLGEMVNIALRSSGNQSMRVLAAKRIPPRYVISHIRDKNENLAFPAPETRDSGVALLIQHAEPIYDMFGNLAYWYHHVIPQHTGQITETLVQ